MGMWVLCVGDLARSGVTWPLNRLSQLKCLDVPFRLVKEAFAWESRCFFMY